MHIVHTPYQQQEVHRLIVGYYTTLAHAFCGEVTRICQPAQPSHKASDCLTHLLPGLEQLDLVQGVALLLD